MYIFFFLSFFYAENIAIFWERHTEVSLLTFKRSYFFGKLPVWTQGLFLARSSVQQAAERAKLSLKLFLFLCFGHRQVAKLRQGQCLAALIAATLCTSKPDAFVQICLKPVSSRTLLNETCKKKSMLAGLDACVCLSVYGLAQTEKLLWPRCWCTHCVLARVRVAK